MDYTIKNTQNFGNINKVMTENEKLKAYANNLSKILINGAKKEVQKYGNHEPYVIACESPKGDKFVKFALEYTSPKKNEPDNIKSFVIAVQQGDNLINKNILKTGTFEEIEKFIKENDKTIEESLKKLLGY